MDSNIKICNTKRFFYFAEIIEIFQIWVSHSKNIGEDGFLLNHLDKNLLKFQIVHISWDILYSGFIWSNFSFILKKWANTDVRNHLVNFFSNVIHRTVAPRIIKDSYF